MKSKRKAWGILFLVLAAGCLYLFPGRTWAFHQITLLPVADQLLFWAACATLIFLPIRSNPNIPNSTRWLLPVVITALILLFPIAHDYYGDGFKVNAFKDQVPTQMQPEAKASLLSGSLNVWAPELAGLAVANGVALLFHTSYEHAFGVIGLVCGVLLMIAWMLFIRNTQTSEMARWFWSIAGCSAPWMWIFFRHLEFYPIVILSQGLFLMSLSMAHIRQSKRWLSLSLVVLLMALRFHNTALLLVPAWMLSAIILFRPATSRYFTLKNAIRFWLLPLVFGGLVLYFFVFGDYNDSRSMTNVKSGLEHLFLPLLPPDPPLHRYHLLSVAHLTDYLNQLWIWSPAAWMAIGLLARQRATIKPTPHLLILFGTVVTFIMFFFMINPLLGMPFDSDLFSIPGIALLVTGAAATMKGDLLRPIHTRWAGMFALFLLPVVCVNAKTEWLSQRLEVLMKDNFKAYYEWSSRRLDDALSLEESEDVREQRREKVLTELQPWATPDVDYEYGWILSLKAKHLIRSRKEYNSALQVLDQVAYYDSIGKNLWLYRMEAHFELHQFKEAYYAALKLADRQYPSDERARSIAIHCALEAELYQDALALATEYVRKWPASPVMQEVRKRLIEKDRLDEIKTLFASGEDN
ncbi:MAG: hypothetical protein H6585_07140 [Flavobacteriales bacterium]|nr:hypothetical protein [Flavobacteriales bacterium]MCB9448101.1 hypothetical protein [Flavobacteriales bacterium]